MDTFYIQLAKGVITSEMAEKCIDSAPRENCNGDKEMYEVPAADVVDITDPKNVFYGQILLTHVEARFLVLQNEWLES